MIRPLPIHLGDGVNADLPALRKAKALSGATTLVKPCVAVPGSPELFSSLGRRPSTRVILCMRKTGTIQNCPKR